MRFIDNQTDGKLNYSRSRIQIYLFVKKIKSITAEQNSVNFEKAKKVVQFSNFQYPFIYRFIQSIVKLVNL